jgi:hypothetical protein
LVLKTYHATDAFSYYSNEVEAFRHLRPPTGSSDPNIIHFHGCYTQNGTYNVILDFADQGNLEEYFQKTLPPTSGSDILDFWASLCGIIKALAHIHAVDVQNTPTGPQILQGWHQDVKPQNILVKSNNSNSPYNWNFILSDLGLSHFKRTTSQESSDIDAYGTQTYGAPECYREDRFLEDSPLPVKQNVDIWSFGCILCEAAVWLIHGYPGLKKFRSSRKMAIVEDPDTKDGDWFHNGHGEVLPIVLETIDGLKDDIRKSDHVTERILDELVKGMLDIPDARPSAKQLYVYATRICKRASNTGPAGKPLPISTASVVKKESFKSIALPPPPPPPPGLPTPTSVASAVSSSAPSPQSTSSPINELSLLPNPHVLAALSIAETNARSQNRSTSNLNVPVQTPSGTNPSPYPPSVTGSVTSLNREPTPSIRASTPTPSIPKSSSSRRPSIQQGIPGSTRPQLPNLRVDVAERWISEMKAGRPTELPHDELRRRLETRDHVRIYSNRLNNSY